MLKKLINQFSERMFAPTDVASVVLFRVGFGLLMFWEVTRYFYFGWVEELFAKPQFHFQSFYIKQLNHPRTTHIAKNADSAF